LYKFGFWSSARRKRIDGLWVAVSEDGADTELVWRRVEGALCLIRKYDRPRYDRLLRDLERVWVRVIPIGIGCYNQSISACEIDTRFVLAEKTSPEDIASTLVHEATHARLMRRGIGYEEELRSRVEAVCFRRQIAFANKLPNGEQVRELANRYLEYYAADAHWTDEALRERLVEGSMEGLRYLGAPQWMIRMVPTLLRLRHRMRVLKQPWQR
jgi:hypothetical protein